MSKIGCEGCPSHGDEEAQRKHLEEMMKKRVKSKDCPYKKTCQQKVLKEEADLMCKDKEESQEAIMIHMNGRHVWEMCKVFRETKQVTEGKLPKDW